MNETQQAFEPSLMTVRTDLKEIGFTVVAVAYRYHVEYTVYEIAGLEMHEAPDVAGVDARRPLFTPLWPRKGSTSSSDTVDSLSDAAVFLHGQVKWDGCSNWHFDEQDRVMLHGCTRTDLSNIGRVLEWCWDQTAIWCPRWDGAR